MKQASPPPADFVNHQRRVAAWVFLVLVAIFGGLIARLVYVNTAMAPRLHAMASLQQESRTPVPARRGSILDVRGRVLAGSRQCYSVFADPSLIDNPTNVANVLAPILEIEPGPLEDAIRSSDAPRFCWLKRKVDDAAAEAVRKLRLAGVGLRSEFERHWPMGRAAAQVLGIVGSDDRGLEGLELVYDRFLRGAPGRRSVLRDARRRALGAGRVAAVEPHDGGHLVLTIDAVIQEQVERRLAEQVEAFGAESGVAVVMSPRTGDVLALANVPTFDPNDYGAFDQDTRRNRVITDPVEPGSTFKPFIAAGALAGGWVNTTERIDCHKGLFYFGSRRMHDTKPHGLMDLREIVVYSSNIGMGILGTRMGNEALYEVIACMGFGSRTQIGLRGESPGILRPLPRWDSYSTTSVTMGQELAVTPIQLANAFCALVNGGYLLRPRCVKAQLNADYTPQESFEGPEIIRRVLDENLSRYMREDVMPGVVARGGKELAVGDYTMCGKTGTAQVPYKNSLGYEPNMYLSSFIGAAPVHDPKIVVLVMIRKPDRARGYYGRVVAGPVVRDIVRATLSYLNVPPTKMLASTGL